MKVEYQKPAQSCAGLNQSNQYMHTFKGNSCMIHHNGDLSGEAEIIKIKGMADKISIDGEDLKEFMRQYIERIKISALEDAPLEKLIGL